MRKRGSTSVSLGGIRLGGNSVAFSPDGHTLASGSGDGIVLLWELTPFGTVSVDPASVQSPAIGEQLTLSLKITDGGNVAGYQGTVAFDSTALRYVESANGDYLPAGAFFVPPVVDGNRVTLASSAINAVSNGDGTLAVITFEVGRSQGIGGDLIRGRPGGSGWGDFLHPQIENGEITEPPQLVGDVNADGVVNIQDLVIVGANFGKTGENHRRCQRRRRSQYRRLGVGCQRVWSTTAARTLLTISQVLGSYGDGFPVLYCCGCRGVAHASAGVGSHGCNLATGDYRPRAPLGSVDTERDNVLLPNYPNPFNPETWIPYQLATDSDVTLTIYTSKGAVVRRFELGHQPAGFYTAAHRRRIGTAATPAANPSPAVSISTNSVPAIIPHCGGWLSSNKNRVRKEGGKIRKEGWKIGRLEGGKMAESWILFCLNRA